MGTTLLQEIEKCDIVLQWGGPKNTMDWTRARKATLEAQLAQMMTDKRAPLRVTQFEVEVDTFVGVRVKIARQGKRATQKELGEAIGLNQKAISLIERGSRPLTVSELIRIAIECQRSVSFFVDPDERHEVKTGWERVKPDTVR